MGKEHSEELFAAHGAPKSMSKEHTLRDGDVGSGAGAKRGALRIHNSRGGVTRTCALQRRANGAHLPRNGARRPQASTSTLSGRLPRLERRPRRSSVDSPPRNPRSAAAAAHTLPAKTAEAQPTRIKVHKARRTRVCLARHSALQQQLRDCPASGEKCTSSALAAGFRAAPLTRGASCCANWDRSPASQIGGPPLSGLGGQRRWELLARS